MCDRLWDCKCFWAHMPISILIDVYHSVLSVSLSHTCRRRAAHTSPSTHPLHTSSKWNFICILALTLWAHTHHMCAIWHIPPTQKIILHPVTLFLSLKNTPLILLRNADCHIAYKLTHMQSNAYVIWTVKGETISVAVSVLQQVPDYYKYRLRHCALCTHQNVFPVQFSLSVFLFRLHWITALKVWRHIVINVSPCIQ